MRYAATSFNNDHRGDYYVDLLKLALTKSGQPYELKPAVQHAVGLRTAYLLTAGDGVNVMWSPTDPTIEKAALPVRVPLDKGILGLRLFLVNQADSEIFARVHVLDDLKAYSAGQAGGWPDTAIMRANGLIVEATPLYENLFKMLAARRFTYLPRGVGEIWEEVNDHSDLGLAVEPHVALRYPYCSFFFVSKENPSLAHDIERGLKRSMKDGSSDALFAHYYGTLVQRSHLDRRLVFDLENPLLTHGVADEENACLFRR